MRILFVTNSLEVGGIETNLVRLTQVLTQRGHDVHVAARSGELSPEVRSAGGTLVPLSMTPSRPVSVVTDARRVAAHVHSSRPDVVQVFSAASAAVVRLSRPLWSLPRRGRHVPPVVAAVMGLYGSPDDSDRAVRTRVRVTAIGAERVVVMAPAIDAVVRAVGVPAERLVHQSVVGVELPEDDAPGDRARVRHELGIEDDDLVVTTIGRLAPRKSHELFVRAAALVPQRAGRRTHFLIAGDGEEEWRLRREVEETGAPVRLLGHRPDVYPLLRASDVCVRPGVVEGFIGITVLEAQALGVPVVSFETEDVRLAVEHERTGLLVPPGDVDALARAVTRLLDDPDLAARLGAAGRDHVRGTYGMPAVVDALEALYRDVLAGRVTS